MNETTKQPAVGYIRVSTTGQAEEGVSLEAQEAKLHAWADLYDYELVQIFRDPGISGRTIRKRPEVQQAIAEVRRLHCPLVFYSLTRLIRNIKEAIQLLEDVESAGGSLATVVQRYDTSTVSGWDRYIIDAWLGEREVREISERTRHAMQHMKDRGRLVGRVPFGKMLAPGSDTDLILCEEENATILRAMDLARIHTNGHGPQVHKIAEMLNQEGRLNRGSPWIGVSISRLLRRHPPR